jgi:hypothetical protein
MNVNLFFILVSAFFIESLLAMAILNPNSVGFLWCGATVVNILVLLLNFSIYATRKNKL